MGHRHALPDRYQEALDFITRYIDQHGGAPTKREIGAAIRDNSTSHVSYILDWLAERNYLIIDKRRARGIRLPTRGDSFQVLGCIAAGEPLAIFDTPEDVAPPLQVLPPRAYALRVKGNSMIEDHIEDGDLILVEPTPSVPNGAIVVATNRDPDSGTAAATLKRFYRHETYVRLQPANSALRPIEIPADEWDRAWEIQGRFLGLFRDYAVTAH